MLKWAASFTLNRLFILAVIGFALNSYGRTSCQARSSILDSFGQALSGLQQITRALD